MRPRQTCVKYLVQTHDAEATDCVLMLYNVDLLRGVRPRELDCHARLYMYCYPDFTCL